MLTKKSIYNMASSSNDVDDDQLTRSGGGLNVQRQAELKTFITALKNLGYSEEESSFISSRYIDRQRIKEMNHYFLASVYDLHTKNFSLDRLKQDSGGIAYIIDTLSRAYGENKTGRTYVEACRKNRENTIAYFISYFSFIQQGE